jgi:hypothetical protein
LGTSVNEYTVTRSKPYELVESAGGCDIVPEGAAYDVKGSETGGWGGGRRGWWNRRWYVYFRRGIPIPRSHSLVDDRTRKDRGRGRTRRRSSKREVVLELVCPPKMRKRWKADVTCPDVRPAESGQMPRA